MTANDNAADANQLAAADPAASVWLHANAGSGKTKVLIDRVARLLLSGVEPQHILCLTYTKAAAAEMQNRLFKRLGAWAMMPDETLGNALAALGPLENSKAPEMTRARQLFARAIETPGGLRIQTIHSFCSTLLRRFPLEAGVSPHFRELDERSAILLRSELAQEIASGPHAAAFDGLARVYTADDLDDLLARLAGLGGSQDRFLDEGAARALFGVRVDETMESVLADVFLGGEAGLFAEILPVIWEGSPNDVKVAEKISEISFDERSLKTLLACEDVFLFGETAGMPFGAKTEKLLTNGTKEKLVTIKPALDAFILRVEDARKRRIALQAAMKTAALHSFAQHFIPAYAARKAAQGKLDFDDLILRARALLNDNSVAQWVLYRLDGGIDHILVDEAQDTSPAQWQVLERLTEAFMDGNSSRDRARTIFVVGDKKQSIYSFQGADVTAFDGMKQRFRVRMSRVGQRLQERDMLHSFRSSPAVLQVVDATFDRPETESVGGQMEHIAFFDQMPGRVELWPLITSESEKKDEDGFDPVDLTTEEHFAIRMGRKVADWIAQALESGLQVPTRTGARPANAGDFLVLVQRRSKIFDALIQACKQKGLAIAGADRLVLNKALPVRDLMALLSFLATDTDDLALAEVLRSPLGGLSEDQLYHLAQGRTRSLWLQLADRAKDFPSVFGMLQDMRNRTDFLRPYDLLERALTRHGGRLRLVARLGEEAEDAIDELLTQALAYEAEDVPNIIGFLSWLDVGDVPVKRQAETGGEQIRVMTVHGAKGLEAPIVILPDTADHPDNDRDVLIAIDEDDAPDRAGLPNRQIFWNSSREESPPSLLGEKERRAQRRSAEDDRLLYVAMTRAQSLLVVGAAGKIFQKSKSWHDRIRAGMTRVGAVTDAEGVMRFGFGDWPENHRAEKKEPIVKNLPDWAKTVVDQPVVRGGLLRPSDLGGAKALPGEAGEAPEVATARGQRLHALLEHLPQQDRAVWEGLAKALQATDVLSEAQAVLDAHEWLFVPDTLAEVDVGADIGDRRLVGKIDRLVVEKDRVVAVDFKSNRVVPRSAAEVPEGILRQMGAYAAALSQIYPDKQIETAILWTATAELMPLDREIVSAALQRALSLGGLALDVLGTDA